MFGNYGVARTCDSVVDFQPLLDSVGSSTSQIWNMFFFGVHFLRSDIRLRPLAGQSRDEIRFAW